MMGKWGFLALGALLCAQANAIIWRADRGITRSTSAVEDTEFPVGAVLHSGTRNDAGSAVLIGDDVILTAAHMRPPVGTTTLFRIGGETYLTSNWIAHTRFRRAGAAFDVAIARLERRVTNITPTDLFLTRIVNNRPVVLTGCGGSGPVGASLAWNWEPIDGTNKLSGVNNTILRTVFDRPGSRATEFEAQLVPGDSGGGLFLRNTSGGWDLAGIAVARSSARYGGSSSFVRLSSVSPWVLPTAFGNGYTRVSINLEDTWAQVAGKEASVEVLDSASGTVVHASTGGLNPQGEFSFRTGLRGSFDVRVRVPGYLSARLSGVQILSTVTPIVSIGLKNGDVTRDGRIDHADVQNVQSHLGLSSAQSQWAARADVNGDGLVDLNDLAIVQGNLGSIGQ